MRPNIKTLLLVACLIFVSACSPLGIAAGAGAGLGIAAAQEGGISGAASDIGIKAKISDLWFRYDVSTFAKLDLTVDQGRVLITGIVQDPDSRVQAVRLAWQVEGVRQVINEIRIAKRDGLPGYVRDQWITTRLRAALTFDRDVQSINYSIDTVQGTVYLMGAAQNQAELNKVIETARTIPHVRQVISYVKMIGEGLDGFYDAGQSGDVQKSSYTPSASDQPQSLSAPAANSGDDMSGGYSGAYKASTGAVESEPLDPAPAYN